MTKNHVPMTSSHVLMTKRCSYSDFLNQRM